MSTYEKKENKRIFKLFDALNTLDGRSKTVKELQDNKEEFSSVFQFAVIGMGLSNLDGYWIKVNQSLCDMLGYSKDELLALRFQDITHPGDMDLDIENVRKFMNGEIEVLQTEKRYIHKSGRIVWVYLNAKIIFDANNHPFYYFSQIQDITHSKQSEEEILAERERLANIIEGTNVGTWEWNIQTGELLFNERLAEIIGYTLEEITPINVSEWEHFVHPEDLREAEKQLKKIFERKKDYLDVENRLKHKDGSWVWVHDKGKVVSWTPDGKPLWMSGMYIGISERKKAEEALISSENRFKTIFNEAPLGIALIDSLTGFIYSVNPMFAKIAGRTMEEMANIDWMSITHPDDIQKDLDNMALLNAGKINGFKMEKRYLLKDGAFVWINMTIAPVFTKDRAHPRHLCMIEDITERKKSEEEIVRLSFHDQLTGLYNRRFFEEELKRLDTERNFPLSIIVGDLNGLKITNDTFGHYEGDKILIGASDILKRVCRSGDILARWGGDEFVVLLPKTSISDIEEIAERIRNECKKTDSPKIPISLSIGSATKEETAQEIQAILMEAESNMYKNKILEKESLISSIIFALDQTLYEKSDETKEHTDKIRDLSISLGKSVKLSEKQLDELSLLASLHDIGKVAIPEKILLKKGKLTEKEWTVIKRHPEIGFNIAQSSPQIAHIAKSILSCHENFDGSGYPMRLKGELIPILSRIMLIADAYDVMTSGRSYKPAVSREDAIVELKRCAGTQFDPELVDKFIEILE